MGLYFYDFLHVLLPILIKIRNPLLKGHLFWKRVSLLPHHSFCIPRDKASPHLPALSRFCCTGVCQLSLWTVPSHLPAVLHERRWGWVASGCLLSPCNPAVLLIDTLFYGIKVI